MKVTSIRRNSTSLLLTAIAWAVFQGSSFLPVVMAQPLSGTKTINPAGGDYDAIADAVADMLSKGIDGPVVFQIADGSYNEQISITGVTGASAVNTITFQPQSTTPCGVIWTYTASSPSDNWIVQLNGAAFVTFKDLCFIAGGASYARIFHILGGASSNSVTGCELTTTVTTSTSDNLAAILVAGQCDNSTFDNNTVKHGSYGVQFLGSSSNRPVGTLVQDNVFDNQYKTAIHLWNVDAPTAQGNAITSPASSTGSYRGIHLELCQNALKVQKNKLKMHDGIGFWIQNCTSTSSQTGLIANNFVLSDGTVTGNLISVQSSTFQDVYFNSILNTGNNSACLSFFFSSDLNVKNNIAVNSNGGFTYEVGSSTTLTSSDYNCLYTTGATLASWQGAQQATLADLQSASGLDANSVSKSVNYLDGPNADLHLTGASLGDLDLSGINLSAVTDDYDGDSRNVSPPYMGADEAPNDPLPVELTAFTVQVDGNAATLWWTTASETNNFGFDVQLQSTRTGWSKIAFVPGHGTTNQPQSYRFTDTELTSGDYQYRLKQIDLDGSFEYSAVVEVSINPPSTFFLSQNYPNPFNPETVIAYSLPATAQVVLTIYNLRGRQIRSLVNDIQPAGEHRAEWDGLNQEGEEVASGVYFYSLRVKGQARATRRMLFLR